jgi:hypothetical protein
VGTSTQALSSSDAVSIATIGVLDMKISWQLQTP